MRVRRLLWVLSLAWLALAGAARAQVQATWLSGAGLWSDPTRWTTNPLYPCNGNGGQNYDVTVGTGTATLDLDCTVQAYTMTAGTRDGAFALDVNQLFTWSSGTIGGTGATHTHGGVELGTTGTKTLSGSHVLELSSGTWSAGQITLGAGTPTLHNPGSSTWAVTGGARSFIDSGDTGSFLNDGIVTVDLSSPTTVLTVSPGTVTNTNQILVNTGILSVNTDSSYTGTFSGAGTLRVAGGAQSLASGAEISTGGLEVTAGTLSQQLGAVIDVDALSISASGALDVVDAATTASTGTLTQSAGSRAGAGAVAASGLFTWTSGTLGGTGATYANGGVLMSSTGTKTLSGAHVLQLSSGTWSAGQITLSSGTPTLHNPLGSTWTVNGGARSLLDSGNTGTFLNDGVVVVELDLPATTLTVSPGTMTNTNQILVNTGILSLNTDSSYTGTFSGSGTLRVAGGAQSLLSGSEVSTVNLEITSGTLSQQPGATIDVDNLAISGALEVVDAATNASTGTLTQSSGSRIGAGEVTASGLFTWASGTLGGTGTTHANGGADLSTTGTKLMAGSHVLEVVGGSWSAGQITMQTGTPTFRNRSGGTFTYTGGSRSMIDSGNTGTFANDGTFIVASTGTLTLSPGTSTNSGTIDVASGTLALTTSYTQTAGSTRLSGGAISSGTPLAIQGGLLEGNGTVAADVVCAGTVSPGLSAGQLTIDGDLTLQPGGGLQVEIEGLTQGVSYDFLPVTGAVTLAGTLSASFLSGFQNTITVDDQLTVLEGTSGAPLVGAFANVPNGGRIVTTPDLGSFLVSYGPSGLLGANRVVLYGYVPFAPEISFHVTGTGQGGTITLDVEGVQIVVATTPGETAADVAAAIAAAINSNAELASLGIVASAVGADVGIAGAVRSVPVVTDSGISLTGSPSIPALPGIAGFALAALLGLAVALRIARA